MFIGKQSILRRKLDSNLTQQSTQMEQRVKSKTWNLKLQEIYMSERERERWDP